MFKKKQRQLIRDAIARFLLRLSYRILGSDRAVVEQYVITRDRSDNLFRTLGDVLTEDVDEIAEIKGLVRKQYTKGKISRALKMFQVRQPTATIQEFNALSAAKRRELIQASNPELMPDTDA